MYSSKYFIYSSKYILVAENVFNCNALKFPVDFSPFNNS